MDDLYREQIVDHYKNPRNFGELDDATVKVRETNASCGDMVEWVMKIDGGKVKEVRFKGLGCAISTAAASMLTEKVKGKRIGDLGKISDEDMVELLGVKINLGRIKCVTLPLKAMQKAVEEYEQKD